MGWAARANVVAQSVKRGDIAPKPKPQREHFKRPEYAKQWAAFFDRVGVRFGKTGNARLFRRVTP